MTVERAGCGSGWTIMGPSSTGTRSNSAVRMLSGSKGGTPQSRSSAAALAGSSWAGGDSRSSALPGVWPARRAVHHHTKASSGKLSPSNIHRSSAANRFPALHRRHAHGLVTVDGHQARPPGLVHRDSDQLRSQLHRALVVCDENELHVARHVAHDVAEAADVVLVERCVHLVQQTERGGVQVEYREHQRHGGQSLLAARKLADGAVALSRRTRHDGHAGRRPLLARELEVGMAAAEQAREFLLEACIDLLEGILEACAGLAIDLAHGRLQGLQRVGQILALPVEVFLALGLLLELADGREIHLAQALDLALGLLQLRFPARDRGLRREPADQDGELEMSRRELLPDALAAHAHLRCRRSRLVQAGARPLEPLLDARSAGVSVAQFGVELVAGDLRGLQLALDLRAHA